MGGRRQDHQAARRDGPWRRYWERFREQEIDEPVEPKDEAARHRFREQRIDDPVEERRRRRR
jgi:hypothetical protein